MFKSIEQATRLAYPNEMVGFIDKKDTFIQLNNIAAEPTRFFEPDTRFFLEKYKGNAKKLVHSHTYKKHLDIRTPSKKDLELQEAWGIPFIIAGFDGKMYSPPVEIPSIPNSNFLDRPYIYGVSDCGMLIRDYYWFTYNIPIKIDPKYSLVHKHLWRETINQLLIRNNFKPQRTKKPGDILLVSILGEYSNHALILKDEHTVINQAEWSQEEPLENWEIASIWRHKWLL
jgi:proteasome lid subunit RPN8/RPN11